MRKLTTEKISLTYYAEQRISGGNNHKALALLASYREAIEAVNGPVVMPQRKRRTALARLKQVEYHLEVFANSGQFVEEKSCATN